MIFCHMWGEAVSLRQRIQLKSLIEPSKAVGT